MNTYCSPSPYAKNKKELEVMNTYCSPSPPPVADTNVRLLLIDPNKIIKTKPRNMPTFSANPKSIALICELVYKNFQNNIIIIQ